MMIQGKIWSVQLILLKAVLKGLGWLLEGGCVALKNDDLFVSIDKFDIFRVEDLDDDSSLFL